MLPASTFGTFGASSRALACKLTRGKQIEPNTNSHTSRNLRRDQIAQPGSIFRARTPTNSGANNGAELLAVDCHNSHQSAISRALGQTLRSTKNAPSPEGLGACGDSVVPEGGLEPPRALSSLDFESGDGIDERPTWQRVTATARGSGARIGAEVSAGGMGRNSRTR